MQAKANQPIWITIAVPTTARAGVYSGDMKITGLMNGKSQMIEVPVSVKVYDVVVGKSRLLADKLVLYEQVSSKPLNGCQPRRFRAVFAGILGAIKKIRLVIWRSIGRMLQSCRPWS